MTKKNKNVAEKMRQARLARERAVKRNRIHEYVMQRELGGPKKKRLNLIQRRRLELMNQGQFLRPASRPLGRNMPGGNPFRPITLRR
ncbi:MAG TPA: hypothetical protein DCW74_14200 [Alteromonas australica]|uniref:Uncharacterized protein n=1 Tax=Alteromonas australica TaxID=589873 RepID=A0A350P6F4_9ALTE|nr:hypothetical protein [Alteromonas australica]